GGHVVELTDDVDRGVELLGDRGDRVAAHHSVVRDAEPLVGRYLRDVGGKHVGRLDRQQQVERAAWIGGPAVVGGIELVDFLGGDAGDLGGKLEVDLPESVDAHEVGLVRDRAEGQSERLRVEHQALHRQQLRHVGACFAWQPQVPEIDWAAGV